MPVQAYLDSLGALIILIKGPFYSFKNALPLTSSRIFTLHISPATVFVVRKTMPLILAPRAPGAHILQQMEHIYNFGCEHDEDSSHYKSRAKCQLRGCLWCLEKGGSLFLIIGPWGPHASLYGAYYHFECVDDQYISPHQTKAKWLLWLLRKSRSLIFQNMPLGPTFFKIYHCGCEDDEYLSPYKFRAKCLLQLLWNCRPLIFWYRLLGPTP